MDASPEAESACEIATDPAAVPSRIAAAAKASQPSVARFQCAALQLAARDARLGHVLETLEIAAGVVAAIAVLAYLFGPWRD